MQDKGLNGLLINQEWCIVGMVTDLDNSWVAADYLTLGLS